MWGVGCGEVRRINKNNLLSPVSESPVSESPVSESPTLLNGELINYFRSGS
ncbi:Malto-oligosyltrehalose synthase [Microcystis panniformis FACHB-1757]|uniref:Malto-oligosyltrehalose synthase n=1 Tax=Microcystis panniformis FACHB-1757 TaxID=1638788 RepID=A0A0K1S5R0_9CHRO|nr:Malto-oligosyltrehalose synthase [Microcystis panniformis FACHB-1757]